MSPRPAGSGWPGPRRPLVNLRLAPDVLARVDAAARAAGVNRSEWLRRAVDAALDTRRPPSTGTGRDGGHHDRVPT